MGDLETPTSFELVRLKHDPPTMEGFRGQEGQLRLLLLSRIQCRILAVLQVRLMLYVTAATG